MTDMSSVATISPTVTVISTVIPSGPLSTMN